MTMSGLEDEFIWYYFTDLSFRDIHKVSARWRGDEQVQLLLLSVPCVQLLAEQLHRLLFFHRLDSDNIVLVDQLLRRLPAS